MGYKHTENANSHTLSWMMSDPCCSIAIKVTGFGIPLSAFSFEKIEACVYLLRQASLMAANTGKARMKPCDGSNPKYQMRTWLLRLGFIGDQYARPRQTLLNGLTGDGAFFSDDGKEKAAMKRKSKRAAG